MKSILKLLWRVARRSVDDQLSLIAAGIAFYALMAVFPGVAALVALAGLVTDADQVVLVMEGLSEILPDDAAAPVLEQATRVASAPESGLSLTLAVGVALSLYLSTRATTGLMHGLNIVGAYAETRGFFRYWFTVILLTAAVLIGALLMLLLLVVVPVLLAYLPEVARQFSLTEGVRWVLTSLVLLAALEVFYRFAPCHPRKRRWAWVSPGIFIALLLWILGSIGFAIYVSNFAQYNEIFGSLGGVIILLTWIWLSSFVVLLGALLDKEIERNE